MTRAVSQLRTELLRQHGEIRARAEATRACLAGVAEGGPRGALRRALAGLAHAIAAHNAHEQELLKDVLPHVDAWGPARTEVMSAQHGHEQRELYAALLEAGGSPDADATVAAVTRLLDRMEEHLAVEERVLLGEDVLHDDLVPREYVGG